MKCYICKYEQFIYNDPLCTIPTEIGCPRGYICRKGTPYRNVVVKSCTSKVTCQRGDEFTVNLKGIDVIASCCKNDLCNESESILQNKYRK